jgi:hypothetical protein
LRSHGQVTVDRLSQIKELTITGTGIASNAVKVAGLTTPGVGIAFAAVNTINSGWNAAKSVVALNNLQHAVKDAAGNPVLQGLAKHIEQERLYNARKDLLSGVANATVLGASIAGAAVVGVGAVAAGAVGGALSIGVSIATANFTAIHERTLEHRRENGEAAFERLRDGLTTASNGAQNHPAVDFGNKFNIGLAERAALHQLRHGSVEERGEVVAFLKTFGLSKQTITKLQVLEENAALKTFQNALYKDKVSWKHVDVKQTFVSFARIVGLAQLKNKIADCFRAPAAGGSDPTRSSSPLASGSLTASVTRSFNSEEGSIGRLSHARRLSLVSHRRLSANVETDEPSVGARQRPAARSRSASI